jgi:hypothetical protein
MTIWPDLGRLAMPRARPRSEVDMPAQPVDRDGLDGQTSFGIDGELSVHKTLTGRASLHSLRQLARPLTRPTGLFLLPEFFCFVVCDDHAEILLN